jgi:hypothetical protein
MNEELLIIVLEDVVDSISDIYFQAVISIDDVKFGRQLRIRI